MSYGPLFSLPGTHVMWIWESLNEEAFLNSSGFLLQPSKCSWKSCPLDFEVTSCSNRRRCFVLGQHVWARGSPSVCTGARGPPAAS